MIKSRIIPVILHDSTNDCGIACLRMVFQYLGKNVELSRLADVSIREGISGLDIKNIAKESNVDIVIGNRNPDDFGDFTWARKGSILHLLNGHYVVLEKVGRKHLWIIDPNIGRRCVTKNNFRELFSGVSFQFSSHNGSRTERNSYLLGKYVVNAVKEILQSAVTYYYFLAAIIGYFIALVVPYATTYIVDDIIPTGNLETLGLFFAGLVVYLWVTSTILVSKQLCTNRLQVMLARTMSVEIISHLLALPYRYFLYRSPGDLSVRISSIHQIKDVLVGSTISTFVETVMAVVYLVLLIWANALVGILVIFLAVIQFTICYHSRRSQQIVLDELQEEFSRTTNIQYAILGGIETIKGLGAEEQCIKRWEVQFIKYLEKYSTVAKTASIWKIVTIVVTIGAPLVVLLMCAFLVVQGNLTIGEMFGTVALASALFAPINSIAGNIMSLQSIRPQIDRVQRVLEEKAEIHGHDSLLGNGNTIELRNISFRYSSQEQFVIKNTSIVIRQNVLTVIIGRSGVGKSTLAKIIAGLLEAETGEVLIGEQNITNIRKQLLNNYIKYIGQEPILFPGTIRENITLLHPEANVGEVEYSARIACIHREIETMDNGYCTRIADRGTSLSGGQRQRISIARAAICKPRFLILDETTSWIEKDTEEEIVRNLLRERITPICITHSRELLERASVRIVIDKNEVITTILREN